MRKSARLLAQRAALVALFALVSHTLLPYLHALSAACDAHHAFCATDDRAAQPASSGANGGASHSDDCPVCSALAHGSARVIDAPTSPSVERIEALLPIRVPAPLQIEPVFALDSVRARAPPLGLSPI